MTTTLSFVNNGALYQQSPEKHSPIFPIQKYYDNLKLNFFLMNRVIAYLHLPIVGYSADILHMIYVFRFKFCDSHLIGVIFSAVNVFLVCNHMAK